MYLKKVVWVFDQPGVEFYLWKRVLPKLTVSIEVHAELEFLNSSDLVLEIPTNTYVVLSAADVKMEIPVLVQSLKSSITSSTSLQMGKTFWGVVSASVEQSRRKVNTLLGETGNFALEADPRIPQNKTTCNVTKDLGWYRNIVLARQICRFTWSRRTGFRSQSSVRAIVGTC